jgi:hypothetical protein
VPGQRRAAFGGARPAPRAHSVRVAAAASDSGDVPSSSPSSSAPVPVLEWPVDNESIKDVFAFAGSAPEVCARAAWCCARRPRRAAPAAPPAPQPRLHAHPPRRPSRAPCRLQRVNGRVAMLGFVGIMLAEHGSKTPALEQFGGDFLGVTLLSLAITFASLFPKFASGSSLKVGACRGRRAACRVARCRQGGGGRARSAQATSATCGAHAPRRARPPAPMRLR